MFELYMFTFIDLYNTYMFYVFNSNENVADFCKPLFKLLFLLVNSISVNLDMKRFFNRSFFVCVIVR